MKYRGYVSKPLEVLQVVGVYYHSYTLLPGWYTFEEIPNPDPDKSHAWLVLTGTVLPTGMEKRNLLEKLGNPAPMSV